MKAPHTMHCEAAQLDPPGIGLIWVKLLAFRNTVMLKSCSCNAAKCAEPFRLYCLYLGFSGSNPNKFATRGYVFFEEPESLCEFYRWSNLQHKKSK
jgi:hypothetical protein